MMEDENTVSADEGVLLPEVDTGTEVQNEESTEKTGSLDEAVTEGDTDEIADTGTGDGDTALAEPVVVADDTETNALLTSLLEQSTELTETVQLVYEETHIPMNEVTVDSLGFTDFMLLGIFLVLLAEFILKHLGGIFRCMK